MLVKRFTEEECLEPESESYLLTDAGSEFQTVGVEKTERILDRIPDKQQD